MISFFGHISPAAWIAITVAVGFAYVFLRQGGAQAAKTALEFKNEEIKGYERKLADLRQEAQHREDQPGLLWVDESISEKPRSGLSLVGGSTCNQAREPTPCRIDKNSESALSWRSFFRPSVRRRAARR